MFVRAQAPYRALTSNGRHHASWPSRGGGPGWAVIDAHRLRHSAATAMLRAGGSLTEIGQVAAARTAR